MDNLKFIEWLRVTAPVLFSPQFWGIVATATFGLAVKKSWIDPDIAQYLRDIFGFATTVGISFKLAKKVALKSNVPQEETSEPAG